MKKGITTRGIVLRCTFIPVLFALSCLCFFDAFVDESFFEAGFVETFLYGIALFGAGIGSIIEFRLSWQHAKRHKGNTGITAR